MRTVCLVAAVAAVPACSVNFDHEGYIVRDEKHFDAASVVELRLSTFDGVIEVRAWDRPEIVVAIEKRGRDQEAVSKIEVVSERTGDRIKVEARHPDQAGGFDMFVSPSARLIANVPKKTNLVIQTGDGSVLVERVDGKLDVHTGDGSIRVKETSGELLAETGDGSMQIDDIAGRVELKTGDGSVRVTGSPAALRARSGDGSIVLRVRAGTVMTEDWMITTGDGSISAELPDGFNADIDADPGSDGQARCDLALANASGGTSEEPVLRGRLGQGGHAIRLRTEDGTIHLIRR
jgi:hypothetical protein